MIQIKIEETAYDPITAFVAAKEIQWIENVGGYGVIHFINGNIIKTAETPRQIADKVNYYFTRNQQ